MSWAGSPVAWKSGRQSLVTTSSAETELLAASEGATLTYSIDAMLSDVGVEPSSREIRVDNSAAITLASEEGGSWRTRPLKGESGVVEAEDLRREGQYSLLSGRMAAGRRPHEDPSLEAHGDAYAKGVGKQEDLPSQQDVQECVRCLQAPAEQHEHPQATSSTTHHPPATAHGGNLGCCMGVIGLPSTSHSPRGEPGLLYGVIGFSSTWSMRW